MKIAIYSRVSTEDQNPENQLEPLRKFAGALNGGVSFEFIDYASGGRSDRAEFLKMMYSADRREFDLLIIWSLDRLSREGISNTLGYLERLKRNGIAVKSLQESWLDTRDEGLGQLMLAIFAWVASQERKRIAERVRAGMARAKAEGKQVGRPTGSKDGKRRIRSGYLKRWAERIQNEQML